MNSKFTKILKECVGNTVELAFRVMDEFDRSTLMQILGMNHDIEVKEIEIEDGMLNIEFTHYGVDEFDLEALIRRIQSKFPVVFTGYECDEDDDDEIRSEVDEPQPEQATAATDSGEGMTFTNYLNR